MLRAPSSNVSGLVLSDMLRVGGGVEGAGKSKQTAEAEMSLEQPLWGFSVQPNMHLTLE